MVLMRIYDTLMALLQATDTELHDKLDEIHESGQLAWSLPYLDLKADASKPNDPDGSLDPSEVLSNTGHLHTHDTHIER